MRPIDALAFSGVTSVVACFIFNVLLKGSTFVATRAHPVAVAKDYDYIYIYIYINTKASR